jgi:hypothetical protein
MSEGDYKVHGLDGQNNIFYANFCAQDRNWRKQLLMFNDKFQKTDEHPFDECNNAFVKPKRPYVITVLDNLHKRSDYE